MDEASLRDRRDFGIQFLERSRINVELETINASGRITILQLPLSRRHPGGRITQKGGSADRSVAPLINVFLTNFPDKNPSRSVNYSKFISRASDLPLLLYTRDRFFSSATTRVISARRREQKYFHSHGAIVRTESCAYCTIEIK